MVKGSLQLVTLSSITSVIKTWKPDTAETSRSWYKKRDNEKDVESDSDYDNYDADVDDCTEEVNLASNVTDEVEPDKDIDEYNDEVQVTVTKEVDGLL